jgi:hypothetical protein
MKMYLLRHLRKGGAHSKIKPAVVLDYNNTKLVWRDQTRRCLIIPFQDSKMVEQAFLSSTGEWAEKEVNAREGKL